jgi:hypothetical protein
MSGYRYRYGTSVNGGTSTSNAATLTVAPAFFPFPVTLDVDGAGNLYVGDTADDVVRKVTPAGAVTILSGTSGQTGTADGTGAAAQFNDPSGLAAAGDGTLAVADTANGTIRRITAAGAVTTLAGSTTSRGNADGTGAAATFSAPTGLAQDAGGNLYVADATNHTLRRVTAAGAVTTFAGSAGVSGSADGTGANARFNHPTGVAVDAGGNVYVADTTNNTIRKITSAGVVTTLAGLAGVSGSSDGSGSAALFNRPGGLAVDGSGNLYVADTGNSTIRRITPSGTVSTYAGLVGVAGLKDGPRTDCWFNQPQDVAVDAAGVVYVADTGNATIRRIAADGTVTAPTLTAGTSSGDSGSSGSSGGSGSSGSGGTSGGGSTGSGGGGGGGGAMEAWFVVLLGGATLLRQRSRTA